MRALLLSVPVACLAQGVVVVGHPTEETATPTGFVETLRPDADPAAQADLADVVAGAVGANLRRSGGEGRPAWLSLRGGTGEQLAVFVDGIPLHGSRGGAFDLSTLPPVYFDRIEILRGPAAARYGGRAQGGVLRLHTRRPGEGTEGFARMRLGSASLAQLDGAVLADGVLLAGGLSAAEGDFRFIDEQGTTRRRLGNDHRRGSGLLRARAGGWSVLVEGTAGERGEPGSELVDPLPDARAEDRRLQAGVAWDGPMGPVEVQTTGFARRQSHHFVDPDALLGPTDSTLTDDLVGGRAGGRWRVGAHTPWIAVEGRHERAAPQSDRRTTLAGVVGELWRPWPWMEVSATARISDTGDREALWVPEGGVEVGPWGGLSLRANVGRIFRDPSFDELHFSGPGVEGNPDLRTEEGVGGDVGVLLRLPRRLTLQLVYFEQRYERIILWVPVDAYHVRPEDRFGATVRGVESGAALRVGPLRGRLIYTWLDHRFDHAPRAPLPFRPAHSAAARVTARVGRAVAYGDWRWRGAVHTDRHGHRTLPGYTTQTLGLRGPVAPGLEVGLEVRNVGDEQARDAVHQPLPGRTWLLTVGLE